MYARLIVILAFFANQALSLNCPVWTASDQVLSTLCIQVEDQKQEVLVNTQINNQTEACYLTDIFVSSNIDDQVTWPKAPQSEVQQQQTNETQQQNTSQTLSNETTVMKRLVLKTEDSTQVEQQTSSYFTSVDKKAIENPSNPNAWNNVQQKICNFDSKYYYNKFYCDGYIFDTILYSEQNSLKRWLNQSGNTKPNNKEDDWSSCATDEQCESGKCLCVPRVEQDTKKNQGRCMTSVYDDIYEEFFEYTCFANNKTEYTNDLCLFRVFIEYGHVVKQMEENKEDNVTTGLEMFTDAQLLNKKSLNNQLKPLQQYAQKNKELFEHLQELGLSTLALVLIILGSIIICVLLVFLCCCCFCASALVLASSKNSNVDVNRQYQQIPNKA